MNGWAVQGSILMRRRMGTRIRAILSGSSWRRQAVEPAARVQDGPPHGRVMHEDAPNCNAARSQGRAPAGAPPVRAPRKPLFLRQGTAGGAHRDSISRSSSRTSSALQWPSTTASSSDSSFDSGSSTAALTLRSPTFRHESGSPRWREHDLMVDSGGTSAENSPTCME
jgi:hypothetical protein